MLSTALMTHPPAPFSSQAAPPPPSGVVQAMAPRFQTVLTELQAKPSLLKVMAGAMKQQDFFVMALGLADARGFSPLHHAAAHGAAELIAFIYDVALVSHPEATQEALQALVDRREATHGYTPLHCAAINQEAEAFSILVEHCDANFNLPDFAGRSPLHIAIQNNDAKMVSLLLDLGANPNQTDIEGRTPLHFAAAMGYTHLTALLIRSGGFQNATDEEGESPLFYAVREGHKRVAKTLLQAGCDSAAPNEDGETALELCEEVGDERMADVLRSFDREAAEAMEVDSFAGGFRASN